MLNVTDNNVDVLEIPEIIADHLSKIINKPVYFQNDFSSTMFSPFILTLDVKLEPEDEQKIIEECQSLGAKAIFKNFNDDSPSDAEIIFNR